MDNELKTSTYHDGSNRDETYTTNISDTHIFESTSNSQQRPTLRMSQSYGGDHSSSFLLRQGIVVPPADSQIHR